VFDIQRPATVTGVKRVKPWHSAVKQTGALLAQFQQQPQQQRGINGVVSPRPVKQSIW